MELREKIKQQQKMYIQKVCCIHEPIAVALTATGIDKPTISYQCKHCGESLKGITY